jgi:histidinol-phosphatase (PHP family)
VVRHDRPPGHPEAVHAKSQRDYDPSAYRERIRSLLEVFVEHEQAFEINTSGIRQRPKTSMPGPAIVRWYVEAGGTRITTGTDSHAAQTVGAGLRTTLDMLKLCGIDDVLSFRRRGETRVPIDTLLSA